MNLHACPRKQLNFTYSYFSSGIEAIGDIQGEIELERHIDHIKTNGPIYNPYCYTSISLNYTYNKSVEWAISAQEQYIGPLCRLVCGNNLAG